MDRRVCFETLKSSPRRTPRRSVDISEPAPAPNRACPTSHLGPAHPPTTGRPYPLSGASPYFNPSQPHRPTIPRNNSNNHPHHVQDAQPSLTCSRRQRRAMPSSKLPKSRHLVETSTQLQKQSLSRGLVPAEPSIVRTCCPASAANAAASAATITPRVFTVQLLPFPISTTLHIISKTVPSDLTPGF